MENPDAEPEPLEERPEGQLSEPAITGSAAIASKKEELRSAMNDIETIFPEGREEVTRAILRIAKAVEAISSHLDTENTESSESNTKPAHIAPAHTAPAMK